MSMEVDQQANGAHAASEDVTSSVVRPASPEHQEVDRQAFSNIMRTLSQTMNASLAELGYFPSLGAMVQELRMQNLEFRDVTARLHADNHTLQRAIEDREQHNQRLQAELEMYKRDFHNLNEQLRQIASERDNLVQYARMVQNGIVNGPQQIPPQMAPPPHFVPTGPPVHVNNIPDDYPYGPSRIPAMYNGGPGANPELSFNMPPPGPPMIQGYHMSNSGMQPAQSGNPRQVMTTAVVPSPVGPWGSGSRPGSRPSSRPASRRSSESAVVVNSPAGPAGSPPRPGSATIRIPPPAQTSGLGTIRIVPTPALGQPSPASAVPPSSQRSGSIIDLTASPSEDTASGEEPTRKRRRVTLTVREPAPPTDLRLDLTTLGDQISQLERSILPPNAETGAPPPPPSPDADDVSEDDNDKDADGLVRVDVCLKIAYEENDGKKWCKMCKFRNAKLVTDEPPVPMSTTKEEDLVKHLEEVHPAGWRRLRGMS